MTTTAGETTPASAARSAIEGWACPRCGRQNKAAWRFCPGCESMADGRFLADIAAAQAVAQDRSSLLPGVFLLVLLMAGAALLLVFSGDIAEAVRIAGG